MSVLLHLFVFLFLASGARADGFLDPDLSEPDLFGKSPFPESFVAPNESNPGDAADILRQAPGGVYLSVGTERGFMGAAMAKNTTHLLLVDLDPEVVRFNRINIALLELSRSRKDYLELRLGYSKEQLLERIRSSVQLSKSSKAILEDPRTWKWWIEQVRVQDRRFSLFQADPPLRGGYAYRGANYLHDDVLFERIREMAQQKRIEARFLDLGASGQVKQVAQAVHAKGLRLSVVDVSNSWMDHYVSPEKMGTALVSLKLVSSPESIVLLSAPAQDPATFLDPRLPAGDRLARWGFMGRTMDEFGDAAQTEAWLKKMNEESRVMSVSREGTLNGKKVFPSRAERVEPGGSSQNRFLRCLQSTLRW